MAVCLPRYLGPVESLPVGMWCGDDKHHIVRCPSCGGTDPLTVVDDDVMTGGRRYVVNAVGVVAPEYRCPTITCNWSSWIVLESLST